MKMMIMMIVIDYCLNCLSQRKIKTNASDAWRLALGPRISYSYRSRGRVLGLKVP